MSFLSMWQTVLSIKTQDDVLFTECVWPQLTTNTHTASSQSASTVASWLFSILPPKTTHSIRKHVRAHFFYIMSIINLCSCAIMFKMVSFFFLSLIHWIQTDEQYLYSQTYLQCSHSTFWPVKFSCHLWSLAVLGKVTFKCSALQ